MQRKSRWIGQAWWLTPVTPVLRKVRQKHCWDQPVLPREFQASLGCPVSLADQMIRLRLMERGRSDFSEVWGLW